MTDPESGDSDEPGDGTTSPKRQKLAPRIVEKGSDKRGDRSPSVISDLNGLVGPENLSDDNLARNADTGILTTPESSVGAPRIYPQLVDIGQEWEYREVLGEEVVDGVEYYLLDWYPTLVPKSSVRNNEVLAEYKARKARARASGAKGNQRGRPPAWKQGSRAVTSTGVLARQQQKRPRGRPRKGTLNHI